MITNRISSYLVAVIATAAVLVSVSAFALPAKADGFEWGYSDGGGYDTGYDWGYSDGGGYYSDYDWGYSDGGGYYADTYTTDNWSYDNWSYDNWSYDSWSTDNWSYNSYPSYSYNTQPYYSYTPQFYSYSGYSGGSYYDAPRYDRPTCTLEISDQRVDEGDSVTLTWKTTGASDVTLSGFGSVSRSGSERVHVTRDTTYNLRVEGRGGSDTCTASVRVEERQHDRLSCDMSASDYSIEDGDDVTLRWDSDGADDARINQGIGRVNESGTKRVSPSRDTTYVLTVENDEGDEEDCSVTIRVDEDDDTDLWCKLTASDENIEEGDRVRLTWDTRGDVRDARINQGIGSVDEDGGSETVTPNRDTRYVLTVEDDDGNEEDCSVTVNVDDGLAPPPDVPLVYLSQLPYTGAEDTMAYWLMMIAGSGVVGYFLFFRAMPFALARVKMLSASEAPATELLPEVEAAPANVTRQDVRAFVSALAEQDAASAREFARAGGEVLFAETAVVLDDVVRARASGAAADPSVAAMTSGWDESKFAKLIAAFIDAKDADATVEGALAA